MQTAIQTFNNTEFGEIRSMEINGEPWFVGKDVATALGYSNPRDALNKHVDAEDKGVANCDTLGGNQKLSVINEKGKQRIKQIISETPETGGNPSC